VAAASDEGDDFEEMLGRREELMRMRDDVEDGLNTEEDEELTEITERASGASPPPLNGCPAAAPPSPAQLMAPSSSCLSFIASEWCRLSGQVQHTVLYTLFAAVASAPLTQACSSLGTLRTQTAWRIWLTEMLTTMTTTKRRRRRRRKRRRTRRRARRGRWTRCTTTTATPAATTKTWMRRRSPTCCAPREPQQ
jgi:hypothetical protein